MTTGCSTGLSPAVSDNGFESLDETDSFTSLAGTDVQSGSGLPTTTSTGGTSASGGSTGTLTTGEEGESTTWTSGSSGSDTWTSTSTATDEQSDESTVESEASTTETGSSTGDPGTSSSTVSTGEDAGDTVDSSESSSESSTTSTDDSEDSGDMSADETDSSDDCQRRMCLAVNDQAPLAQTTFVYGNPLGISLRARRDMDIIGVELFTGEGSGDNEIAIWSDGPDAEPGEELARANWTLEPENAWQGADFATPVAVADRSTFWLLWYPVANAQASISTTGTQLPYVFTRDDGATWSKASAPWMVRVYCCE